MATNMPTTFGGWILFILEKYGPSLLHGAGQTIIIALVGTLFGCLIGFIIGIVQTIPLAKSDHIVKKILLRIVRLVLYCYVEVFRGTPMMVQAVFIYFGSAYLGIDMPRWFAAYFIVSINTGAYMAETVRGGILSIDEGQTEGAKAIGMNHVQTMVNVILPQALRNILPQISNNLIINIKDTCVLSMIGVVELFFSSKSVSGTYYTFFQTYTITMAMYLIMTVFFSRLLRAFEKRMDGPDSYDLATKDPLTPTSGLYKFPGKKGDLRR